MRRRRSPHTDPIPATDAIPAEPRQPANTDRRGPGPVPVLTKAVMLRLTVGEHALLNQIGEYSRSASFTLRQLIRQEGKRLGLPEPPTENDMRTAMQFKARLCQVCKEETATLVVQHPDGLSFSTTCDDCATTEESLASESLVTTS